MELLNRVNHPVWLGIGATVLFSLFVLLLMSFGNLLHSVLFV